ncbi:MAG: efflux RND transporter permease subunit [Candidatus Firestonebacteria bacterium]|nr:efflux RND transporter permease subunit [Candidatus Firestonebacteria bacterium]
MNLAGLSIKRPTFITAVLVIMLLVGLLFMSRMSVDMFPDVNFPFITVTTIYPGAGPKEVETLISKVLEEQIASISGLKNVTSVSQDGVSSVWGEFTLETDPKYAEQQIKDKVAQVRNRFPADAKEPVIRRYDPADRPVVMMSLTADLPGQELYDLADNTIRNTLEQVSNVSSVEIVGGTKREIHADLDLAKLKEYEVGVSQVVGRVGANSQNIPIGKVSQGKSELSFRSLGELNYLKQVRDVVVSFFGNDVPITLDKLGEVSDGFAEVKTKGYLNGKSTVVINVYKQSGSNTVEVSDTLQKRLATLNEKLIKEKGGPKLTLVQDSARGIRMNLKDVRETIFQGIILAIIVVYFFLGNFRSTLITVVALPNSLVGAFIFMGLAGFSINMMTLMALSLAVGLLIDDAIVVRENIFRHIENGEEPKVAAQKGTDEVTLAVVATTLTVIAVFLPVGFLQGMVGQFFKQFGLTVVFAMGISLFDALTTAPMFSAYLIGKAKEEVKSGFGYWLKWPARSFGRVQDGMDWLYEKAMRFTLRHNLLILGLSMAIFLGSLGFIRAIPKTFMPANSFGEFTVHLEAKPGISLEQMDQYTLAVERLLRQEADIDTVLSTVGNDNGEGNVASLFVKMVPVAKRHRDTGHMREYVRERLKPFAAQFYYEVNDLAMAGNDKPFAMLLIGDDLEQLAAAASQVIGRLKTIPNLVDINSNYKPGKPEFQFRMNPIKMERLGVLSVTAGMELRNMVEGAKPAKFREHGLEYDVRVRLQNDQRDLSRQFDRLYVPNVNNQLVKLRNIADPLLTSGPSKITRRNRSRYVQLSANMTSQGAVGDVTAAAKKIMAQMTLPAGIHYQFIGASEDMADLFKNMMVAAALSIIFIYLVLASLYESLILPFTIMLALPLAMVGGFVALYYSGQMLNMFSMIGFIMLLGLVTKNSILLVDYTQKLLRQGLSVNEALIKAGLTRLRPIMMTTFALIAGMLPLALGLSETGSFRQSMGITIIGGLISSTLLTLVVIPAAYGYMEALRVWSRRLLRRPALREVDKDGTSVPVKAAKKS